MYLIRHPFVSKRQHSVLLRDPSPLQTFIPQHSLHLLVSASLGALRPLVHNKISILACISWIHGIFNDIPRTISGSTKHWIEES